MNLSRTHKNNPFSALLLASLILCLTLSGCGKKAPVQPIELPIAEASVETSAEASVAASVETAPEASVVATTEASQDASSAEVTASEQAASTPEQTQPQQPAAEASVEAAPEQSSPAIDENGVYTTKEDVALYIHTYGKLPGNFITKKAAKKLGWEGGSLESYAPGKCIGGDYFGNYEGLLPEDKEYHECDIDTLGKSKRGAKRIIYSDDGYIYYTGDHYETFELLYEP